uniref:Ribonuclease H-like domain-containing protein n=1 Tax=Tanacetum cinerariifolium TaxID=118510 RepID=A0A699HLN5_TANCI|nr:ribonuclease H-like domain-containing protein [Tanacetum cinerariifolium]
MPINYAADGRLRKLRLEVAWETIEDLARYEEEGWNDPVIQEEGSLDYENPDIEYTLQVIPSFEENAPPVTYPDKVEETIGLPIEVEPLDETPLEDLGLNTCNHDIPLSSGEIISFEESKPQPQPFPSFPSLEEMKKNSFTVRGDGVRINPDDVATRNAGSCGREWGKVVGEVEKQQERGDKGLQVWRE